MVIPTFLRRGIRISHSACLCIVLCTVILLTNDQTMITKIMIEYQKGCMGRNVLRPVPTNNITEMKADKNIGHNILLPLTDISDELYNGEKQNSSKAADVRDKYSKWIPHPEQTIASLSANPYVIKNSEICRGSEKTDLIFLINSATGNFGKRQGIRSTWGNVTRLQRQYKMQVVFLLGLSQNYDHQMKINKENEKNHDIVQGNFVDTYHNITHKSVLGLRWVSEFCSKARRVIKVDDDVFIDTVKLFSDYKTMVYDKTDSIYCYWKPANTIPILRTSGKWKVNVNEFRNLSYYPLPYCEGFFIVLSPGIASKLYKSAYDVPFFWIDDFYISGMLTDKAGINQNITNVKDIVSLSTYYSLDCFGKADKRCRLLVGNAPSPEFMQSMWQKMLTQNNNMSLSVLTE